MGEREELLNKVYRDAFDNERNFTGCSQTVLAALMKQFKEITPEVFRSGSALAGGVARQGESCAALIGAIMAVSAVMGRQSLENMEQYQHAMENGIRVFDRFKAQIGHTLCADIHKARYGRVYNLTLPEEREKFREIGCRSVTGCPVVCGTAARIAAEVILDIKGKIHSI